MKEINFIGITDWRNTDTPFGIKEVDRFGHIYAIGKTGVGKSTLLLNMAISDIQRGNGLCIIDPHGDIAETVLNYVQENRIKDVIYFNPQDLEHPIGFNPLSAVDGEQHHLIVSSLVSAFKKIWYDSWGPRLEYILRFALLSLLSYPDATLLHIQPILTNIQFRNKVLDYVNNRHIIEFWKNEFEKYPPALKAEAIAPILNKTGSFITNIPLRNIVGQAKNSFSIMDVMDNKKILVINLAKGQIGEEAALIMGSMLITSIQVAAMKRSSQVEANRIPFFLYIDEMHSFVSLSFADILSEVRKYKLALFLTHQYIDQLEENIRKAIFGNVGTIICFRVGGGDAEFLEQEFSPVFTVTDLINLPRYSMYLKMMIDGTTSKPFSAKTVFLKPSLVSYSKKIKEFSRQKYCQPKEAVEARIFPEVVSISAKESANLFF